MNPQTFRQWLAERGCSFDQTKRDRGEGITALVVKLGPRQSLLPDTASSKDLPESEVRRIMDELELPYDELPGPQGRR